MPKSKHRKNHKKKLKARKEKIQREKNKMEKHKREVIEQILKEQQEGKFDEENVMKDPDKKDDLDLDI